MNSNHLRKSFLFFACSLVTMVSLTGCQKPATMQNLQEFPASKAAHSKEISKKALQIGENKMSELDYVKSSNGLMYKDEEAGSGDEAKAGQKVSVHYTGTFESGEKFDSSKDRGQPFQFKLGAGQVIKGWDQGVAGMKVGGKRVLVIPPDLAYGPGGIPGAIPPNSTLKFEVELLGINN